jgi:hypothetical protein
MDKETLNEIDELLHIASWCAGKLNASIVRGEVSSRAEFEALIDARERITTFRERITTLRTKLRGVSHE